MTQYIYKNKFFPRTYLNFDAKDEAEAWAMVVTLTTRPKDWTLRTEKDMIDEIVKHQKRCKRARAMMIELSKREINAIINALDSQQVRLGRMEKVDALIKRLERSIKQ